MLPFGVTIPATVPQRSEFPEGLMNYLYYWTRLHVDSSTLKHTHFPKSILWKICFSQFINFLIVYTYEYIVWRDLKQVILRIFVSKCLLPATFCEWCEWLRMNDGVWGFRCVSGSSRNNTLYCIIIITIIINLVITFMHGIYNYIPATNHVSSVYNVAAVLYLQFVLHVLLLLLLLLLCLWDECCTNYRHFVNALSNLYCKMLIVIIYNIHFPVLFKSIKWMSP